MVQHGIGGIQLYKLILTYTDPQWLAMVVDG